MNNRMTNLKDRYRKFAEEHPFTAKFLPAAGLEAGLTAIFAGAAWLAFIAAAPTFPLYLPLTLIATAGAIGTGIFAALGVTSFALESKTSATNDAGQVIEGPRWAVRRIIGAEKKIKQFFNKQSAISADPDIAEARAAVTIKPANQPAPKPGA